MAAPTYATELVDITTDSDAFTAVGAGGAVTTNETDFFIQNTNCLSKATGATWDNNAYGGALHDDGAARTIPTNGAVFAWIYFWGSAALATEANGGYALAIGNLSTAYKTFEVRGSDTWEFGGWECVPVDPNTFWASPHRTVGAPDGTYRWFGAEARVAVATNIGKGNPFGLDAIRYGRGELRCTDGDGTNGYASFGGSLSDTGAAAWDNTVARRYGMLTPRNGAYFQQGLFIMGLAGTPVDFRDSNRVIFIQNTKKVASAFNGFEVRNVSSNVLWTNISVQALGTVSRGYFLVTAGTVTLDSCTFTDMDTFTFLSSTSALDCIFRRTNAITAPGSNLSGSSVLTPTVAADAAALIWNVTTDTDGKLNNMTFSKGTNAHHAIQFGASADPVSNTLRGITFTGFNAANGNNDSALYFSDTGANVTWTVNLIGCSGTISYKKVRAGDTVSLVSDPVSLSIHVQDINTGASLVGARVYIPVTSTASGRPYNQTINSITRTGPTATVTFAAAHNLATNDYLKISGCDQPEYNHAFQVTVTGTTTLEVTVSGTPASGSGTMVGTWIIINDVTNGSGDISASYTYAASQPINGRVRAASGAGPYYKTAPVSGIVSNTTGLSVTVQLIPDS